MIGPERANQQKSFDKSPGGFVPCGRPSNITDAAMPPRHAAKGGRRP
jgi:hypothetical protein